MRVSIHAAAAALILLVLALVSKGTPSIVTDADFAVTELYTELATRGALQLGPYSRFGWHHPGPIYFYVQAPLYALAGHRAAALYAGATAINLIAIVTLTWVLAREGRRQLAALLAAACVVFAWRAPRFLASPWTAHVPILPAVTFLVLCAAIAAGRVRLLPLAILFGTFVAQTHVGFVPTIALLFAAAIVSAVSWRDTWKPRSDVTPRPILIGSLSMLVALWLIPALEAIRNGGGNGRALWRFFLEDEGRRHSAREALVNWSYGLTGVLRADFALPWGGHFVPGSLWWGIPLAIGQVLLLIALAHRDRRSARRLEASLALLCCGASLVGLWAITRIRDDILDHELFWLSALGTINLALIAASGLRFASPLLRWSSHRGLATTSCAIVLLAALVASARDFQDFTSFERRRRERMAIVTTYEAIRDYVRANGIAKPLIEMDGSMWSHAAGVLLRLRQDRVAFAVERDQLPIFTNVFAATGAEDAVIAIRPGGAERRPGRTVLIDARAAFVDAARLPE